MSDDPEQLREESARPPSPGRPLRSLPILLGVVLGIGIALFIARGYFGDPSPPLTSEALQAAEQRWTSADIGDYRVEVAVTSRQNETYAVEVRDGRPQLAWRNGNPLKQLRTFDTWSVPGMFETIHTDLDRAHQNESSGGGDITLRCTFDEQTGVPRLYRRIEFENDVEVSWIVTKLESLETGQGLLATD